MSLKTDSIKGVTWTTVSTIATSSFQLIQLAILARILEPEVFGLMAIVTIVIGFSIAFMDMGISNAIIHFQKISIEQLSTLYWLNVISGIILFIIIKISSSYIAIFYNESELQKLVSLLALSFVFQSFGQQFMILLQKNMQFNKIAITEIIATFCVLFGSVSLAVLGFGIFSLIYGTLIGSAIRSIQYFYHGSNIYRPKLILKLSFVKEFIKFGLYQMGEKSLNYFSANVDKIIIGKFIGFEALGYYNMAWQLIIFPVSKINPIVNKVAFPVFAKVQNNNDSINYIYEKVLIFLFLIVIPLLIFLYYFSSDVVHLVYGAGWEKSANIVSILAFVGILKTAGNPSGSLLLGIGRADVGFWWNFFWLIFLSTTLSITLLINPTVLFATYSLLGLSVITTIIYHIIIKNICQVKYKKIIYSFIYIMIVTGIIGYISYKLQIKIYVESVLINLAISILTFFVPYILFAIFSYKSLIMVIFNKKDRS